MLPDAPRIMLPDDPRIMLPDDPRIMLPDDPRIMLPEGGAMLLRTAVPRLAAAGDLLPAASKERTLDRGSTRCTPDDGPRFTGDGDVIRTGGADELRIDDDDDDGRAKRDVSTRGALMMRGEEDDERIDDDGERTLDDELRVTIRGMRGAVLTTPARDAVYEPRLDELDA